MDPTSEAERLNEIWDEEGCQASNAGSDASEWTTVIRALRTADSSTPDPDPQFLMSLRASLERHETPRSNRSSHAGTLGIVARPALSPYRLHPRRLLTAGAVLGSLILALVASESDWPGGRPHSLGVATVAASSTAIVPTPTPTLETVPTVPTTSRG